MRHLVFINGPWQAIAAFASLKEANVSPGDIDLILVDQNEDIAAYKVTRRLVSVLSQREPEAVFGAMDRREQCVALVEYLIKYRGRHRLPVLWLNSFHRHYAKYACEQLPKATIWMYEDGGRNYVDAETMRGWCWLRGRYRWPGDEKWRHRKLWTSERINRIAKGYLLLLEELGCPNYLEGKSVAVSRQSLIAVLEQASAAFPEEAIQQINRDVEKSAAMLLVGQNLSRGGNITWEEELSHYEKAARLIQDAGYVPVWKDHPRNEHPFSEALRAKFPDMKCYPEHLFKAWPLELIFGLYSFHGSVSMMSSSLFYLKRIHNIPCYTFVHWVMDNLKEPYYSQARLFYERALPIEELIRIDKRKVSHV